jgi:UDP-glucuronate 4-epimerase
VNCAGNGSVVLAEENPMQDWESTVSSAVNLGKFCRSDHFVHFSSGAVYDSLVGRVNPEMALHPRICYGISKHAAEQYCLSAYRQGTQRAVTVVRFFGAYGPHEPSRKIFSRLVRSFAIEKLDWFSIAGDGKNFIDAMYVDDAVRGVEAILAQPPQELVVDFANGSRLTINELVQRAAKIFGIDRVRIMHSGHPVEYIEFESDPSRFENYFKFRPTTTLAEGLRRLATWLDKSPNLSGRGRTATKAAKREIQSSRKPF